MLAIGFMDYNFCRKHATIKSTPAVAAGMADHQWTLDEVAEMMVDAHFVAKVEAQFEEAFANFTPQRVFPKSYPPQTPKLPWYLDPNSSGPK